MKYGKKEHRLKGENCQTGPNYRTPEGHESGISPTIDQTN